VAKDTIEERSWPSTDSQDPVLPRTRERSAARPAAAVRQQTCLRALQTIPGLSIHLGHYLVSYPRMPLRYPPASGPRTVEVVKSEEKGSDVNLATYLLLDAFRKDCDTAVVITNDSDLREPIEIAQAELGLRVGVINPQKPGYRSRSLLNVTFRPAGPAGAGAPALRGHLRSAGRRLRRRRDHGPAVRRRTRRPTRRGSSGPGRRGGDRGAEGVRDPGRHPDQRRPSRHAHQGRPTVLLRQAQAARAERPDPGRPRRPAALGLTGAAPARSTT
jgi:uncharacterized LabA/DUF88 family protein